MLSHEQQDMQLNPLTCPESDLSPHKHSGKGFSGKSKPPLTSQLILTLGNVGRRQICLRLG